LNSKGEENYSQGKNPREKNERKKRRPSQAEDNTLTQTRKGKNEAGEKGGEKKRGGKKRRPSHDDRR